MPNWLANLWIVLQCVWLFASLTFVAAVAVVQLLHHNFAIAMGFSLLWFLGCSVAGNWATGVIQTLNDEEGWW